jgi:hypothetical protein
MWGFITRSWFSMWGKARQRQGFTTCPFTKKPRLLSGHKSSSPSSERKSRRTTLTGRFSGGWGSFSWQVSWGKSFCVQTCSNFSNSTSSRAVFSTRLSSLKTPCANCTWRRISCLKKASSWSHSCVTYYRSRGLPLSQNHCHKWSSKNTSSSPSNTNLY